jgi:hypothetical protein
MPGVTILPEQASVLAPPRERRAVPSTYNLFMLLLPGTAVILLLVGWTLPDETSGATVRDRSSFINERLQTRWRMLNLRLRAVTTRQQRLREERERAVELKAANERSSERARGRGPLLDEWNRTTGTWEEQAFDPDRVSSSTDEHNRTVGRADGLAPWARHPSRSAIVTLLSPPPPLGPAVLLRSGLEGGCLYFQEPLELLARATCDLEVPHQRFVWEPASRTLR